MGVKNTKDTSLNNDESKKKKIIVKIIVIIILILLLLLFRKPKYDIIFDSNGGSDVSPCVVEKNKLIKEPKDPVKEGYIFAGWYYNDELYDFSTPVKKDMKLEARWVVGEITDIKTEQEKITLESGDNEKGKVTAVKVKGITLDKTSITMYVSESIKLSATIKPGNATNKSVTWSSSDSSVATVDQNGNVKALRPGKTTITVTTKDGNYKAKCVITVKEVSVTGVSLNKTNSTLYINESTKLVAMVNPSNATNKNVTWSSSDSSVATVDQNGNVKALKPGTATITVKTKDGNYTAVCIVTVKEKESNYVVIIDPIDMDALADSFQYKISVTKDGKLFTNYYGIEYNGIRIANGQRLQKDKWNSGIGTAKVYINGSDTPVNATVTYN